MPVVHPGLPLEGDGGTFQLSLRTYREYFRQEDLVYFQVVVKDSDLYIGVRKTRFSVELAKKTEQLLRQLRSDLEEYIARDPTFATTLQPYLVPVWAPPVAQAMAASAQLAGVGPMAAVAGAFADAIGKFLGTHSSNTIVENGGDIYLKSTRARRIGIYAGKKSPFTGRVALEIPKDWTPLGICTSSGTVGPSLSFGEADAAIVLARTATLADAVATATANRIKKPQDLKEAINFASQVPGVIGAVAIKDDQIAAWGQVRLVPV